MAPSRHPLRFLAVAALALAVFAAYRDVVEHPFTGFDDGAYVYDNPRVRDGLTLPGIAWAFTTFHAANWHPLTWVSHMTDVELFGLEAGRHHLSSLILHCLNGILLLLVLARMTGAYWNAVVAAALFALHPLRVESVAWVAERKDLLSGFFFLLSLWGYARYAERPGVGRYLPVALFSALGLLSKPMAVTLPFVLLLLDWWPLGRFRVGSVRRLALEKVPLLVMSAASCWATYSAQLRGGSVMPMVSAGPGLRLANALLSYVDYAATTMWPSSLAFFYPFPFDGIDGWKVAGASALLFAITGASFLLARRRPYVAAGWFWYLGMLVPVIGVVQVGMQAMADRYTYLPSIGLSLVVVWGARDALGETTAGRSILRVTAAGSLAGLAVATWIQVGYWRNDSALAGRALRVTRGNSVAWNLLGKAHEKNGAMEKAVEAHRESVRLSPEYAFGWNSLGSALFAMKRHAEALACFREAVRIRPDYAPAWLNIGTVLRFMGRHSEALPAYGEALRLDPGHPAGWNNLGTALGDLGRYDEALNCFRKAVRIDPSFAEAWSNLGVVHRAAGRDADAIQAFRAALRLRPDHVPALRGLAEIDPAEGERSHGEGFPPGTH